MVPQSGGGYEVDVIERSDTSMVLSMGPQHPSTHGVLQIITEIEGEIVTKASPEIGYLHTGIEKSAENLFWSQASTVIERMDYLSPLTNALCYYLAVEKLLGIDGADPAARAAHPRAAQRALAHRLALRVARHGRDRPRRADRILLLLRSARADPRPVRDVGRRAHAPELHPRRRRRPGPARRVSSAKLDGLIAMYEPRMRDVRRLLQKNPILQDRMIDVGIISPEDAVAWSLTGPVLRATGIAYDVRKAMPYSGYERYEFDLPVRTEGDAYARFLVRLDEMDEAMRIIRQVRKELDEPGPWQIADTKFAPPPKETIALSMEALIHHFKLVSESFRVPPGDVYQAVEGPRGELGYYVVSNGDNRPWRVRTRPPSLYNLQVLKKIAIGELIADMVVMIGSLDPVFGEVDR